MNRDKTSPTPFSWKRLGWLVIEILLFVVILSIVYGFQFVLAGLLRMPLSELGVNENDLAANSNFMLLSEAVLAVGSLIGLLCVHKLSHKVFPYSSSHIGLSLKRHGRELWAGIEVAVGLYGAGFLLVLLLDAVAITDIHFHASALLQTWVFFFFVAVFEETMCRGFLLGRMMDAGINKFVALILSSAVFSMLHLANPNFAALPFANLLLAGILLGSAYIYTRNLWFAITLHWFWNWLQGPVLGFEVSGNKFGESLLTLKTTGNTLLNGGPFGFEGSLICTALMLVSIFLIIRYYEKKKRWMRQARQYKMYNY